MTDESWSLIMTLPYPPSINKYWLLNRNGSRRLSADAVDFRNSVIAEFYKFSWRNQMTGMCTVVIDEYPKNRIRRDRDNVIKPILDALTHAGVWEDDEQVYKLLVRKHGPDEHKKGYVTVKVKEIDTTKESD